jgi:hypothetical protein
MKQWRIYRMWTDELFQMDKVYCEKESCQLSIKIQTSENMLMFFTLNKGKPSVHRVPIIIQLPY